MNPQFQFVREVALQADALYEDSERFGIWAAEALGRRRRSQITSLENIANSSLKVTDILDYLKKQTAKASAGESWRFPKPDGELGPVLINYLSDSLRQRRDVVTGKLTSAAGDPATPELQQQAHLALIREFVRQLAAQYEMESTQHAE